MSELTQPNAKTESTDATDRSLQQDFNQCLAQWVVEGEVNREDSTSDSVVWVLKRERARTFNKQDGQTMLKRLKTAYRLPGEPQLRELD